MAEPGFEHRSPRCGPPNTTQRWPENHGEPLPVGVNVSRDLCSYGAKCSIKVTHVWEVALLYGALFSSTAERTGDLEMVEGDKSGISKARVRIQETHGGTREWPTWWNGNPCLSQNFTRIT